MAPAAAAGIETPHRPPADWARAAEGIQMAGIALFLLLNTTGVLPWSFWLEAIALWPVLIMSAGIKVAFERSRVPWLLLLGPALVLGSLTWIASGARADLPLGPWTEETKPRDASVSRLRVTTSLAGSRLELSARELDPSLLVEARSVARHENSRLDVSEDGGTGRVRLKGGWRGGLALPRKQRWDLRVPSSLPVELDLHGAGVRSTVDLSRGRVDDGRIDGVFLGTELRLPVPERPVKLVLNGVFNALHVVVPEGVPVRVEGAGFPFNAVERGVPGDASAPGYQLTVSGIFSAVTLTATERPAPSEARRDDRRQPVTAEAPPTTGRPAPTPRPKPEAEPAAPPAP
jgi:hypothetical protein